MAKIKFSEVISRVKDLNKLSKNKKIVLIGFVVLLFLGAYFFFQNQKTQSLLKNPNQVSDVEVQSLVSKVGKLIELPIGENPTIATVSDKTKLQDQDFFKRAENGDKVLIYANAKKAILYRPSINKIIDVAPVNIDSNTQTGAPSSVNGQGTITPTVTSQPKALRVAVYNGTEITGLAGTIASKISTLDNVSVVGRADAANEYQETLVIDLIGTNSEALSQFTGIVGGKTQTTLPSGETKPDADILIIVGADYEAK